MSILVFAVIAMLPSLSLLIDRGLEVFLVVLVFVVAHPKGIIQVVDALWVVWFGNVRLKAFADLLCLPLVAVGVDKVLILDFVPGWPSFLARSDPIDFLCVVVFDDEVDELAPVGLCRGRGC